MDLHTSTAPRVNGQRGRRTRALGVWLALPILLSVAAAAAAPRTRAAKPRVEAPPVAAAPEPEAAPPPGARKYAALTPIPGEKPPIAGSETVAIFEYRNDVKALSDLPERLSQALSQNTSLQVVTLGDARRRLGPAVDADVARCDGQTGCLSAVGERLNVREVLLLAVSQLGDVVMALQRIDVASHRVVARYADSLVTGQQVDEPRLLGWLQQLYPPETFKRYGQIRISTDVSGAQVYVNAKPRGKTPLGGPLSVLAPGNYRLLVEKDQFLPFQANITVMPDTTVEVDARLLKENVQQPWYRRWYVWAGLGVGLAAVAATGVAIYYGTAQPPPDMTRVPGTIVFK